MYAGIPGHTALHGYTEYGPLSHQTVYRMVASLLILGTLFALDILSTQIILHMGGVELNPLMLGIVTHPALHIAIKTAILLVIFPVSLIAEQRVRGSSAIFYYVLISLYVFVIANNLLVILPKFPG